MASGSVVVLGASAGLGAALAYLHFQRGDSVIAVARRSERLAQLAKDAGATAEHRWLNLPADISEANDLNSLVSALADKAQPARIYFVAAADEVRRPGQLKQRLAVIEKYHRLLFTGLVGLAETLEDKNIIDVDCSLVAISSIAAGVPFKNLELYSAGKAALEAWSRAARLSPGPRRVIVRPGRFDSDFFTPRPFDLALLPMNRAHEIIKAVDCGKLEINLGGLRDVFANNLERFTQRITQKIVSDATPSKGD